MKKILVCLSLLFILAPVLTASADTPALVDAGVADAAAAPAVAVAPSFVIDAAHPLDDASSAWGLVKQAGWLWGGMAILFGLGSYVIKKNSETHWLANDHILSVGTTVLGVMGAIINAHFGAGSWAAVIPVLVAGIALIVQKPKPASAA